MAPPRQGPLGLQVIAAGDEVARAFDDALAGVNGSHQEWLALVTLKGDGHRMHPVREAVRGESVGPADQLGRMEAEGLVRRSPDPGTGLAEKMELTDDGEMAFRRYMKAVAAFDRRLRAGLTDEEAVALSGALGRIRLNASA